MPRATLPREALAAGGAELRNTLHGPVTAVSSLCLMLALGFGATLLGRRFLWYSVATIVVTLGAGVLAGLQGGRIEADLPTPWAGLEQRISAYTFVLWVAVLAIGTLRTLTRQTGAQLTMSGCLGAKSGSASLERRTRFNGGMRLVVLTGAGISAESGVPTFRDAGGLWEGHRVEDVATPEAFERDADTVHRFYDARRHALARVEPNPAHDALARLEHELGDDLLVVTQNVDDLHERAGSRRVLHMHGDLLTARCTSCDARSPVSADLIERPACPECGERMLRPDVVWFGEMPYDLDDIDEALLACDVFAAIGTSGAVYPAAGFVMTAASFGARTIELNLAASEITPLFEEVRHGPASIVVPTWVDEMLAGRD